MRHIQENIYLPVKDIKTFTSMDEYVKRARLADIETFSRDSLRPQFRCLVTQLPLPLKKPPIKSEIQGPSNNDVGIV